MIGIKEIGEVVSIDKRIIEGYIEPYYESLPEGVDKFLVDNHLYRLWNDCGKVAIVVGVYKNKEVDSYIIIEKGMFSINIFYFNSIKAILTLDKKPNHTKREFPVTKVKGFSFLIDDWKGISI